MNRWSRSGKFELEWRGESLHTRTVTTSPNRAYTLLGKTSLDAPLWARSPDLTDADFLSTNRFFKVSVELK